jgi:hypothetical protein
VLLIWAVLGLGQLGAHAYEGPIHQQLTFIAVRHFNNCVDQDEARFSALQTRYMVKANVEQADGGFWRGLFRWNFYNRDDEKPRSLLWIVETRLHRVFEQLVENLDRSGSLAERYSNLGRVVNHLQDMTSPAHVVPVFMSRWWRLNVGDRFDEFPVDEAELNRHLGLDCIQVKGIIQDTADAGYDDLLRLTAGTTFNAVKENIGGLPFTWEVFWKPDEKPGSFGEYGPAGNNFGRETEFKCTSARRPRCVLLNDDPLYLDFARARHLNAVQTTIAALARARRPNTSS